jgi:hypothetical protein
MSTLAQLTRPRQCRSPGRKGGISIVGHQLSVTEIHHSKRPERSKSPRLEKLEGAGQPLNTGRIMTYGLDAPRQPAQRCQPIVEVPFASDIKPSIEESSRVIHSAATSMGEGQPEDRYSSGPWLGDLLGELQRALAFGNRAVKIAALGQG